MPLICYDTCLTHGHRKLRLVENFEMLRLKCDFKTLRQPDARQTQCFEIMHFLWPIPSIHNKPISYPLPESQWMVLVNPGHSSATWFWNGASDAWFQNIALDVRQHWFYWTQCSPMFRVAKKWTFEFRKNNCKENMYCVPEMHQCNYFHHQLSFNIYHRISMETVDY